MKYFVIKDVTDDTKLAIIGTSGFTPPDIICSAPDGVTDPDILDIVDDIDPLTNEIIGKKAVVNATKESDKAALMATAATDKKWADMRSQRGDLLSACDYILMPDHPMTDKSAWETYRQELRNLPAAITDIDNITWPTKPS